MSASTTDVHTDTTGKDMPGRRRRRRRRHSAEFKQSAVSECMVAGVSIPTVALRHGLSTKIVRTWVIESERKPEPTGFGGNLSNSGGGRRDPCSGTAGRSPTPDAPGNHRLDLRPGTAPDA